MTSQGAESPEPDMLIGQFHRLIRAVRRTLRVAFRGAAENFDPQAKLLGYSYGPGCKGTAATLILSKTGIKIRIRTFPLCHNQLNCWPAKGKFNVT